MELACRLAVLLCLSSLLCTALAANVVGFNISRVTLPLNEKILQRLSRRQSTLVEISNEASDGYYQVDVTIGKPPQDISLILDTGSTDVWVPESNASICSPGCVTSFDPSESEDFKIVLPAGFGITYAGGTRAKGDYVTDTFGIGNVSMSLQMGLASNGTANQGIMGLGYDTNEAALTRYPSFMDQMTTNKLIKAKAYSLWLNDVKSTTGSILFGGIDTAKFSGPLTVVPVVKDSGYYASLGVYVDSITIPTMGLNLTASSFKDVFILDSGTTVTYLPPNIALDIWSAFGVVDDTANSGAPWIDCDSTSKEVLAFGFGAGNPIYVTASELILPITPSHETIPGLSNPCLFGIFKSDNGEVLIGDSVLRSAYVVYHLGSNQIGLAQSALDSKISNIIEIPASGIPTSLTGLASASTAGSIPSSTVVATASTTAGGGATVTVTMPGSSGTNDPKAVGPSPEANNHTVAIAVGVTIPVVAILAGLFGFIFWWKRRNSGSSSIPPQPPPYNQDIVERSVRYG